VRTLRHGAALIEVRQPWEESLEPFRGKALLLGLGRVGHADQYDVTMRVEPRIRSELAGTDLKLQLHRRVTAATRRWRMQVALSAKEPMSENIAALAAPTLPVSPCHDKSSTYASVSSVCPPVNASLRSC
jgi:hypothetical protein